MDLTQRMPLLSRVGLKGVSVAYCILEPYTMGVCLKGGI